MIFSIIFVYVHAIKSYKYFLFQNVAHFSSIYLYLGTYLYLHLTPSSLDKITKLIVYICIK